jgi:hypothetical protein
MRREGGTLLRENRAALARPSRLVAIARMMTATGSRIFADIFARIFASSHLRGYLRAHLRAPVRKTWLQNALRRAASSQAGSYDPAERRARHRLRAALSIDHAGGMTSAAIHTPA